MNPYTNQGNQNNGYSPYGQQQPQQYMNNLPPEMQSAVNGFSPQKLDGNASNSSSPQQTPTSFDPSLMASLVAKRQMYGQSSTQQQQQPFSPTTSSMGAGSPMVALQQSPIGQQQQQQQQSPMMNNMLSMQQQAQGQAFRMPNGNPQQQWNKQQPMQGMGEGQRQQLLMMQQQQQMRKQQQFQQMQQQMQQRQQQTQPQESIPMSAGSTNISTMSPINEQSSLDMATDSNKRTSSPVSNGTTTADSELNTKRVEVILAMNIELFRLCIESQRAGMNLEQNLAAYQAKLQSNLTYLATMADISMVKAGEEYKAPTPPDLSPLPPPNSDIGKKIHEILNTARGLFANNKSPTDSPRNNQQLLRQQAAAMRQQQQQQFLNNAKSSPGPSTLTTATTTATSIPTTATQLRMMDPQSMLRQAQQAQQNMLQQQQLRQQQMMMGLNNGNGNQVYSPTTSLDSNQNTPQQQQQQLSPNDVLNANNLMNSNNMMMNPNNIMNMYNSPNSSDNNSGQDDPNNYSNVMLMMQRLQQQQQQQQP